MRKTILTIITGIIFFQANAQQKENRILGLPSRAVIRSEVKRLTNYYMNTINVATDKTAADLDLKSLRKNFSDSAIIEVTRNGLRDTLRRRVTEYFTNLRTLLKNGTYDQIKILFRPTPLDERDINFIDELHCYVDVEMEQLFIGSRNGQETYKDVTRKRIWMVFTATSKGFTAKITNVTIVKQI